MDKIEPGLTGHMATPARRYAATAAALGFVSGALTTLAWMVPGDMVGAGSSAESLIQHIAPGLLFGVILGLWIARVRPTGARRVAGFVLLVELAWLAAFYFAKESASHWDGIWYAHAEIGIAAGFIGGLGVAAATALAFRLPLRPGPVIAMVTAAAAAGALLPVEFEPDILTPLFYVWQAAVAAPLGWVVGLRENT